MAGRSNEPAASRRQGDTVVERAELDAELARIERSKAFRHSAQLRRLLRFLALTSLAGSDETVKELTVGVEALGRDPATFDPKSDPIVRVEARRLRAKLADYYTTDGADAAFEIDVPRGGYLPVFRRRAPIDVAAQPSVAVLPFANATGDAEREPFCDGLTDDLIDALTRVPDLRVVGRASAFKFKGRSTSIAAIGAELGVAAVLEGSVATDGDRLRIAARLTLVRDRRRLWSEIFELTAGDVHAVPEALARDIVRSLAGAPVLDRLSVEHPRGIAPGGTASPIARDHFDRAMMIARTLDIARYPIAERLLDAALELDPAFARAHVVLAVLETNRIATATRDASAAHAAARAHLDRALALEPGLASAQALRGGLVGAMDGDWDRAEAEIAGAVRAAPGNVTVRTAYANLLSYLGRFAEAQRHYDIARGLDPLHLVPRINAALMLYFSRRFDESVALYRGALDVEPDGIAVFGIVAPLVRLGRHDEALAFADRAHAAEGQRTLGRFNRALTLAAMGRRGDAEADLATILPTLRALRLADFARARVLAELGEWDAVLDALDAAAVRRESNIETCAVEPGFAPLHGDPRWAELIARRRLPVIPPSAWGSVPGATRP